MKARTFQDGVQSAQQDRREVGGSSETLSGLVNFRQGPFGVSSPLTNFDPSSLAPSSRSHYLVLHDYLFSSMMVDPLETD